MSEKWGERKIEKKKQLYMAAGVENRPRPAEERKTVIAVPAEQRKAATTAATEQRLKGVEEKRAPMASAT
jgi:hypothetical protein